MLDDHDWLGAHLFFEGDIYSEVCDRVLLEVAAPLVKRLAPARWFFVRYSEGGPHLRLRFFAPRARLAGEVRPVVEEAAASAAPLVSHLAFVPYEPEVERYGGPRGLVPAEELFHRSSETALALLRKIDADPSARFGKALLAMLIQWYVFCGSREAAAAAAASYSGGYLRARLDASQQEQWQNAFAASFERQAEQLAAYVEAAWEALAENELLTTELDDFRERLQETAADLRSLCAEGRLLVNGKTTRDASAVIQGIVPSYLHMMNNRLGVSIQEECYLAGLIGQTLVAKVAA